jgi:hypothetical protein
MTLPQGDCSSGLCLHPLWWCVRSRNRFVHIRPLSITCGNWQSLKSLCIRRRIVAKASLPCLTRSMLVGNKTSHSSVELFPLFIFLSHVRSCACLRKDPEQEFRKLSIAILHTSLDWALNLRRGKNGRWLPGISPKSSRETFWKMFRLVFERATSEKIGKLMNRQMHRVRNELTPQRYSYVI